MWTTLRASCDYDKEREKDRVDQKINVSHVKHNISFIGSYLLCILGE